MNFKVAIFLVHESLQQIDCFFVSWMYAHVTTQDLNMNRSVYIEGVVFSALSPLSSDPEDHPRDEA